MPALLITRSIAQVLTLILTIATSTILTGATLLGAYSAVFELQLLPLNRPLDLPATHFMVILFVILPLTLTVGICDGSALWVRMFRALRPSAPAPDLLTDTEVQKLHRNFTRVTHSQASALRKRLALVSLVTAVAVAALVSARKYL